MKKLLILSGKGGTGKTTTAAAFIRFSGAAAIADCDVDAPNLHIVAGVKGQPEKAVFWGGDKAFIDPQKCVGCGLCASHCRFDAIKPGESGYQVKEFSCEGCGVCAAVCPQQAVSLHSDEAGSREVYSGSPVFSTAKLKMGRGNSGKLVTEVKKAMLKAAEKAEAEAVAIIDGSPGIGCPVIASVSGVDLVLIVAEPSLSGRSDLERILKTAQILQTPAAVCVNKYDASPENARAIEEFCQKRKIPFVGRIPYDKTASAAINSGCSIADFDCPARRALYEVYQKTMSLLGKDPYSSLALKG